MMTHTPPAFGLPGELLPFLEPLLDELWPVVEGFGTDEALRWLDAAASDGRLPRAAAEHVRAWNEAKRTAGEAVLLTYLEYAVAYRDDWLRDEATPPDLDDAYGDGWRQFLVDPHKSGPARQGRNERCACGSGRKFKHCCGKA